MHLTKMEIQEFGLFQSTSFESMGPGLTVVFGRNETGKTTLMHFLRGMFYGFSSQERSRYLTSRSGGNSDRPGGGTLQMAGGGDNVHELTRTATCNPAGIWQDQIVLKGDGAPVADPGGALLQLLGSIDEATFVRIYSVGLAELQELNLLGNTDAAQLIYRLTSGVDRVSLIDILDEVNQNRQAFLSADGKSGILSELNQTREAAQLRLTELQRRGRQWGRLATRLQATEEKLLDAEKEIQDLENSRSTIEMGRRVYREWNHRANLVQKIESLAGQVPTAFAVFSDDPIARLDDFGNQVDASRQQIDEIRVERKRLKEEAEDLDVNQLLIQQAPRIDALAELSGWIANLDGQRQGMETEIKRMDEHLSRAYGIQGDPGEANAGVMEITPSTITALRGPARQWREERQRLRTSEKETGEAEAEAELAVRTLDAALSSAECHDLDKELEEIAGAVALLRQREANAERLEHLRVNREDVVSALAEPSSAELLSPRAIIAIGVSFVAGFMCLAASILFGGWLGMSLGLRGMFSVMGLGGVVGSVAAKILWQRNNVARLDLQKRQLELLSRQEKECAREGERLELELGPTEGTRADQLAREIARLGELEDLVPLEAARRAASQNAQSMVIRQNHATTSFHAAEQRWADALGQAGLPATLLPRHIRQYANDQRHIQEQQRQLEQRKADSARSQMELDSLRRRIEQVYQDVGLAVCEESLPAMLRDLTSRLSAEKGKLASYRALAKKDRGLKRQISRHKVLAEECDARRLSLLTQTGCSTESEFRTQAESHSEFLGLRTSLGELEAAIDSIVGDEVTRVELEQVLTGKEEGDLGFDLAALGDRIQGQQDRWGELKKRAGTLESEMRAAEDDGELALAALQVAGIEHDIEIAGQSWRSWEITRQVLGLVREEYESQRQPETLQEASRWLQKMTGGRYTRVWTPIDEDSLLLDDDGGQVWPLESLSSGTRESVYLSLRLSLIEGYRKRGIVLPVVLDDVLVNFDAERTSLAIDTISEFAALGHQVLFFTCHAHVKELFSGLDVDSRELELRTAHAPRLRRPPKEGASDDVDSDEIPEAEIASPSLAIAEEDTEVDSPKVNSDAEETENDCAGDAESPLDEDDENRNAA